MAIETWQELHLAREYTRLVAPKCGIHRTYAEAAYPQDPADVHARGIVSCTKERVFGHYRFALSPRGKHLNFAWPSTNGSSSGAAATGLSRRGRNGAESEAYKKRPDDNQQGKVSCSCGIHGDLLFNVSKKVC